METKYLIEVEQFCTVNNIELSFVSSLHESGLIQFEKQEERVFLHRDQIRQLEKLVCFHYDLDINLEGIEAISHLLLQIDEMQHEITSLKNRLRVFSLPEED